MRFRNILQSAISPKRVASSILGRFCTSNSCVQMQDWEYVSNINSALKKGELNSAINFLIQSHLEGKILDMQIYRNLHYYMVEQKMDISYHEICYKIYREYFRPHLLMESLMKTLWVSEDLKTKQLLKQDFQVLKLNTPANVGQSQVMRALDRQEKDVKNQTKTDELTEQNSNKMFTIKIKRKEEMKTLIQTLMNNKANVAIEDLQIFYNDYLLDEDNDEINDNQILQVGQPNLYDDSEDSLYDQRPLMALIKIGKIEISGNKHPQNQ